MEYGLYIPCLISKVAYFIILNSHMKGKGNKMNNKKLFTILMIIAVVFMLAAGTLLAVVLLQPEDFVINNMQIVLPAEPTVYEQTAADELVSYIQKITSARLPVVNEGSAEVTAGIYIGNTQFAAANKVKYPEAQYNEGWAIKAVKGNLVLTGGDGRGVLYSVYHLLEDEFGVRWWTYWEEDVPEVSVLTLAGNYEKSGKPAMAFRDVHGGKTSVTEVNLFCVRNRLNGDTANAPAEYGGEEAFGDPAHVHTFNRYFDINDYNAHPEWFAYVNGSRISNGQLCLTNEELMEEMTLRVLKSIETSYAKADAKGINRPRYFDVSPNDQEDHCGCAECIAERQKKGHSGLLLSFVNAVAANVAEVYPEVFIETLAYQSYIEAPIDDTKPADNVVIRLCLSERDVLHDLNHENNQSTVKQIKNWVAITKDGQLYVWDYCVFYMNPGVSPTQMNYSENFKVMQELGVDGYFGEMENPIMTEFWEMKFWMTAKLAEDPSLDENKLIDEFLNGYYGAAGPYLRQYLELVHSKSDPYTPHWSYMSETMSPRWINVETMIQAQGIMDQAMAAVADDDTLLRRVRHSRFALDRVFVERHEYYAEEAAEKGLKLPFTALEVCQRIVDVMEEQNQWRGEYDYDVLSYLDIYKRKLNVLMG